MYPHVIDEMIDEARGGGIVAYMGRDHREVMHQVQAVKPGGLARMSYGEGDPSADFSSGGRILFMPPSSHRFRGRTLDAAYLGHGTPPLAAADAEIAVQGTGGIVRTV